MTAKSSPARERYKAARYARRHPAAAAMRSIAAASTKPPADPADTAPAKETDQ